MRGERTSDRDALINRYGLSRRLAARVGALLSKKVDVSPTLLETVLWIWTDESLCTFRGLGTTIA